MIDGWVRGAVKVSGQGTGKGWLDSDARSVVLSQW